MHRNDVSDIKIDRDNIIDTSNIADRISTVDKIDHD